MSQLTCERCHRGDHWRCRGCACTTCAKDAPKVPKAAAPRKRTYVRKPVDQQKRRGPAGLPELTRLAICDLRQYGGPLGPMTFQEIADACGVTKRQAEHAVELERRAREAAGLRAVS